MINFIGLRLKNQLQINAPTESLDYRVFMELFLKWLEWVHESFAIIILRRVLKKLDANYFKAFLKNSLLNLMKKNLSAYIPLSFLIRFVLLGNVKLDQICWEADL